MKKLLGLAWVAVLELFREESQLFDLILLKCDNSIVSRLLSELLERVEQSDFDESSIDSLQVARGAMSKMESLPDSLTQRFGELAQGSRHKSNISHTNGAEQK